jgi:hypothetical protein
MTWDSVPWFVGGGAQHSPEVARLVPYALSGGAEGIVESGDLKVVPLSVPGGGVRVLAGGALILNRAAGGAQQTYVGRNPTVDQVTIAATGSGGSRTDLIVAQVEDPNMPGEPWQDPANPTVGPYIYTRVIPNVPAGTTRLQDVAGYEGRSAVTLARVTLPASTGTVTAAMITDLRKLARPRSERVVVTAALPSAAVNLTSSSYIDWPNGGVSVVVPEWATRAAVRIEMLAALLNANVGGDFRAYVGGQMVAEQGYNYDVGSSGNERVPLLVAGTAPITKQTGDPRVIKLQGRRTSGSGYLSTRPDAPLVFDVQFYEVPV